MLSTEVPGLGQPDVTSCGSHNSATIEELMGETSNVTTPLPFWENSELSMHPYWKQYRQDIEAIPDGLHYALGIYFGLVGFIGVVGNLLVIYFFSTNARLRSPPNMLVINLAVSDLASSSLNCLCSSSSFNKKWMYGKLACELYAFMVGTCGMCSINTLACISLNRHLAIIEPFSTKSHTTHQRVALQIVTVWFLSVLWTAPPMFNIGIGSYIPEGFQTSCSFDYLSRDTANVVFNYLLCIGGFCIPVALSIYCYANIVYTVYAHTKHMIRTLDRPNAMLRRQDIRLSKVAAGTITLFVVSWLPYAVVAQLGILGYHDYVTPYSCEISVLFAKAACAWNPVWYALRHPTFRVVIQQRLTWLLCCKTRDNYMEDSCREFNNRTTTL